MNEAGAGDTDDPIVIKLDRRDIEDVQTILSLLSRGHKRILIEVESAHQPGWSATEGGFLQLRAREILEDRRRRQVIFNKSMFGEPAWEMLLLLYAQDSGQRQTVNRLIELSEGSKTTALRWIDYLETQRLIERSSHPTDRRMAFVELTEKGRGAIEVYLSGTIS